MKDCDDAQEIGACVAIGVLKVEDEVEPRDVAPRRQGRVSCATFAGIAPVKHGWIFQPRFGVELGHDQIAVNALTGVKLL